MTDKYSSKNKMDKPNKGWVGFYGISTIVGYLMPNPLDTYLFNIKILRRIWLGWVLWHINHCWLFNAKSYLYIYIKYIGFGLVGFYDISTIVIYLIPNPAYTYINIFVNILLITFLNEPELIFFLHTVK